MQEHLLTILRDKRTKTAEFGRASVLLARLLAAEALGKLPAVRRRVKTPCGVANGVALDLDVMVVLVLRSGLALLPAFMEAIPGVAVGILGLKRDEKTARAHMYFMKLPKKRPRHVIILDPMLATGGSALQVLLLLKEFGYEPEHIYFTGVVAAQDGYNALVEAGMSTDHITVAAIDPELNDEKYIVPGLGDYGDRCFGTDQPLSRKELAKFLVGKHRALIPGIVAATRLLRKGGVSEEVKEALGRAARAAYRK